MYIIYSFTLLLSLLLSSSYLQAQEVQPITGNSRDMDIFLCIGQSNMAGRAPLTPQVLDTLQGVWLLNAFGEFEPAVNPMNRYSNIRKELSMQRLGPVYSFAQKMHSLSHRPIGLIVNARGGSSINSWLKNSPDGYYDATLQRVREALRYGGRLCAVIWHQGEADCAYPETYKLKLVQLISDLREDLDCPDLPVVVGEISRWNWTKRPEGTEPFNQMISQIGQCLLNTDCVSSEGLCPYLDETDPHFSTESQLILGYRYAEKVWYLLGHDGDRH